MSECVTRSVVCIAVIVMVQVVVTVPLAGGHTGLGIEARGEDGNAEGELPAGYTEAGILVNLPAASLVFTSSGQAIGRYPVAVGRPGRETPVGDFLVTVKVSDPWWYPAGRPPVEPGPDNPLGSWWFGLNRPGYGIHGTNNEASIGGFVSDGCVRMREDDVKQLARKVEVGMPVRIANEPLSLLPDVREDGKVRWNLGIYPDPYGREEPPTYQAVQQYLREQNRILSYNERDRLIGSLGNEDLPVEIPTVVVPELPDLDDPEKMIPTAIGDHEISSYALSMDDEYYLPLGAVVHRINLVLEEGWDYAVRTSDGSRLTPTEAGFLELDGNDGPIEVRIHRYSEKPPLAPVEGVVREGEFYVPKRQLQKILPISCIGNEYGIQVGWRTLHFGTSIIGIYQHRDDLDPHLIPVTEVEMLFGSSLNWCAQRREVALFGRPLKEVHWEEELWAGELRPWISLREVAEMLNMVSALERTGAIICR